MLSRIADSFFWLARYIGRAEDTARILDVKFHTLLEQPSNPTASAGIQSSPWPGKKSSSAKCTKSRTPTTS